MSEVQKKNKLIFSFKFIQVLSVIIIILFHFNINAFGLDPNSFLIGKLSYMSVSVGDMGISLFIIISGVTLMMTSEYNYSLVGFFKKRILSIFPAFWIAYIVTGFFYFIINKHTPGDEHYWKFLLSIFGIDGFFLYRIQNYYLVGEWFTGYLLITYIFFPILKKSLLQSPGLTWLATLTVYIFIHVFYKDFFLVYETCNPLSRLPDFLFGMTFYSYIIKSKDVKMAVILLSVLVMLAIYFDKLLLSYNPCMQLFGISLFVLMTAVVEKIKYPAWFIEFISTISAISFTAFLIHHQIIYFLSAIIKYNALTKGEIYYYFIIVTSLSFIGALILEKPINVVKNKMKLLIS